MDFPSAYISSQANYFMNCFALTTSFTYLCLDHSMMSHRHEYKLQTTLITSNIIFCHHSSLAGKTELPPLMCTVPKHSPLLVLAELFIFHVTV